jgi:hypothetical protein
VRIITKILRRITLICAEPSPEIREQAIDVDQFPFPVQVVSAVLLVGLRGSMAYPELQVTRTVVEMLVFVVFSAAFEIFRIGQNTTAKSEHTIQQYKRNYHLICQQKLSK